MIISPLVLFASTYLAFNLGVKYMGLKAGYFTGITFYWAFWGCLFPLMINGKATYFKLFAQKNLPLDIKGLFYLAVPVAAIAAVTPLNEVWGTAGPATILISLIFSLLNGSMEEAYWRGSFVARFPDNPLLNMYYPSLTFALWHLSVFSIIPSRIFLPLFLTGAFIYGLCWAYVANRTKSIRWNTISHALMNFVFLFPALIR
jgi:membrane protease YdiL (CAAX protease family)